MYLTCISRLVVNAVAVRAQHDGVFQRVSPSEGLRFSVVNVAARCVPSATLALVSVVADGCLRPTVPCLVAVLSVADDVALAFVPRAVRIFSRGRRVCVSAAARLNRGCSRKAVGGDHLVLSASARTHPCDVSVRRSAGHAQNCESPDGASCEINGVCVHENVLPTFYLPIPSAFSCVKRLCSRQYFAWSTSAAAMSASFFSPPGTPAARLRCSAASM